VLWKVTRREGCTERQRSSHIYAPGTQRIRGPAVRSSPLPQDQEISSRFSSYSHAKIIKVNRSNFFPTHCLGVTLTRESLTIFTVLCAPPEIFSNGLIHSEGVLLGENVLMKRNADALVNIKDCPPKQVLRRRFSPAEIKNMEDIGGNLYLTNYRLLFQSHAPFNRLTGKFSISILTIQSVT